MSHSSLGWFNLIIWQFNNKFETRVLPSEMNKSIHLKLVVVLYLLTILFNNEVLFKKM